MRRKPSVLLLSILAHGVTLFFLGTADLWLPITHWPVPHEVLAFSEDPRLVRLADIELPRAPRVRASDAPVAPVPELAPVAAASGVAPETGREGDAGRPSAAGIETTSAGAIEGIGGPGAPPPPPPAPAPAPQPPANICPRAVHASPIVTARNSTQPTVTRRNVPHPTSSQTP